MAKGINSLPAFIGYGSSLSTVVDTGDDLVVGLIIPDVWTSARVSIQVSTDGALFHDLFDFDLGDRTSASEVVFNVTLGVMVAIDPNTLLMARYIKLRSGTRDEPVDQAETCSFGVVTIAAASASPKGLGDETDRDQIA
jgi:hypothetical protein